MAPVSRGLGVGVRELTFGPAVPTMRQQPFSGPLHAPFAQKCGQKVTSDEDLRARPRGRVASRLAARDERDQLRKSKRNIQYSSRAPSHKLASLSSSTASAATTPHPTTGGHKVYCETTTIKESRGSACTFSPMKADKVTSCLWGVLSSEKAGRRLHPAMRMTCDSRCERCSDWLGLTSSSCRL